MAGADSRRAGDQTEVAVEDLAEQMARAAIREGAARDGVRAAPGADVAAQLLQPRGRQIPVAGVERLSRSSVWMTLPMSPPVFL